MGRNGEYLLDPLSQTLYFKKLNFKVSISLNRKSFFTNILILFVGVLSHLAETLKPVELLALLPSEENPVFVPHLKRCIEKHQADLLKHKIISLGQEIKSMMLY